MEPFYEKDEKDLSPLLREWRAPAAPECLNRKVLVRRQSWTQWFTRGTIRIPVPVAVVSLIVIVLVWLFVGRTPPTPLAQPVGTTTLADFQPVQQLEPRIIEANHVNNDAQKK